VKSVLPILLLGLAGLLAGGVVSLRQQGARAPVLVFVGLLAAVSAVAGVLWLLS
jgi:hypothetical protein